MSYLTSETISARPPFAKNDIPLPLPAVYTLLDNTFSPSFINASQLETSRNIPNDITPFLSLIFDERGGLHPFPRLPRLFQPAVFGKEFTDKRDGAF